MTRKPVQYLIVIASALWVAGSAMFIKPFKTDIIASPNEGFMAPDFPVLNAKGETVMLSDFRGQAVLLNLWASWCQPCKAEMPAIERVYQKLENEKFEILAVNMTRQDNYNAAQQFILENQLNFPVYYDPDGVVERLYRMQALPTTFFIDESGIIQSVVIGGPMPESLILSKLEQILVE